MYVHMYIHKEEHMYDIRMYPYVLVSTYIRRNIEHTHGEDNWLLDCTE